MSNKQTLRAAMASAHGVLERMRRAVRQMLRRKPDVT
jgi:hypothetical protein